MASLDHIYRKLERTDKRATSLVGSIEAFCNEQPITFEARMREGRLGVDLVCRMEDMTVPLLEWSVDLSEIVHLLRSALDNLIYVCAQSVADPPPSPKDLKFPMAKTAKEYSNQSAKVVPQLPTRIADLLRAIQPFQRDKPGVENGPERDPLVTLNWLSNADKHRMPAAVLVPPKDGKFVNEVQFENEADAAANLPPDVEINWGPLSHGSTVISYRTKHPLKDASGKFTMQTQVAFETPLGLKDAAPTLQLLTSYTRTVVDEFAKTLGGPTISANGSSSVYAT